MVQTISSYLFSVYNATLNYENPTLKHEKFSPLSPAQARGLGRQATPVFTFYGCDHKN
jgi:hypothetical protein